MSGHVVQRLGHSIKNGAILYREKPLSWSRAEKIARRPLDRRKNYCVISGQVCSSIKWTSACSGCTNGHEDRGFGCGECGYTGKVRRSQWFPDDGAEPKP